MSCGVSHGKLYKPECDGGFHREQYAVNEIYMLNNCGTKKLEMKKTIIHVLDLEAHLVKSPLFEPRLYGFESNTCYFIAQ